MNIFALDKCPVTAARLQCDRHVVKMVVESAQMLSTAHRMLDGVKEKRSSKSGKRMVDFYTHPDAKMNDVLYKAVHFNHPCTVWTMEASANYMWHYRHFLALCYEYEHRYGKIHSTYTLLKDILQYTPKNIKMAVQTPFKLAMKANPECVFEDAVKSYRAFYQTKQDRFKMVWTNREMPEWFKMKETLQ